MYGTGIKINRTIHLYVRHVQFKWWNYAQPANFYEDWTHFLLYSNIYITTRSRVDIWSLILWKFSFFLFFFDPIPGHGLLLQAFRFTQVGHTTLGSTSLDEWSDRPRNLCLTTHNTHKGLNIHPPGPIRNHDPSKRQSKDPRLSPHGHWDWPLGDITVHWIEMSTCLSLVYWITLDGSSVRWCGGM